ncbi:hypothetical protein ACFLS5_01110 [Candidatus Bipolaricaulota bacterium]
MKTLVRGLVTGILVAAAISAGLSAQADPPVSQLHAMLSYVPAVAAMIESGWAAVRFVDYEALFESEGLTLLRALGTADLLMNAVPLGPILGRIVAGPEALTYLFVSAGQMADVVGFEWLLDVDRSLEFGDPPDMGLLLGGDFDAARIGATLESRGFSLADIQGVTVWHRFDDLSISLAERDVADPFGGYLGAAARIALLPDTIGNTRTWPLIEAIISTAQSTQTSLADDPVYRALAEAVSASDSLLIQALFFSGTALRPDGVRTQTDQEPTEDLGLLPQYLGAVLADHQEGDDQVHLIALVCADDEEALTAADVLARRVEEFHPASSSDDVLVDRFGATVSTREIRQSEDGLAVAVVEARYPIPAERTDPETGQFNRRGLLFRAWVGAILHREFTPLW